MNQEESYIHGMLAFPLLEFGRMEEAAAASRKGFEINKADAWAHHCVSTSDNVVLCYNSVAHYLSYFLYLLQLCHVLQHECQFKEAVEYMEELSESWHSCSSFL